MIFWTFFLKIIAIAATLKGSIELACSMPDSANPEDALPLAGAVLTEDGDAHELADERGMDKNSDAEEISTDERAERDLPSEKKTTS